MSLPLYSAFSSTAYRSMHLISLVVSAKLFLDRSRPMSCKLTKNKVAGCELHAVCIQLTHLSTEFNGSLMSLHGECLLHCYNNERKMHQSRMFCVFVCLTVCVFSFDICLCVCLSLSVCVVVYLCLSVCLYVQVDALMTMLLCLCLYVCVVILLPVCLSLSRWMC